MTPSTQNLNAKLSSSHRSSQRSSAARPTRRGIAPPVRIAGRGSSYRGGYVLHANA